MNGTATCGERVVIVEIHSGHVNLKSGRISDVRADNRNETVVLDVRFDWNFMPQLKRDCRRM
jgi:hypothetical protein